MLSIEDVVRSTDRVLAFFKGTPEQKAQYATAIREAVGWMSPYEFEETCKVMVKDVVSGRMPTPKQFAAVYHQISKERGWVSKIERICPSCGGFTWVYCNVKRESGEVFRAMKGCPQCRKDYVIKEGLTEVVEPTPSQSEVWAKMSDAAKTVALEKGWQLAKGIGRKDFYERFVERVVLGKDVPLEE